MKGTNELILNESTMMEIVQQWYDRTHTEAEKAVVTAVTPKHEIGGNHRFVVVLSSTGETRS